MYLVIRLQPIMLEQNPNGDRIQDRTSQSLDTSGGEESLRERKSEHKVEADRLKVGRREDDWNRVMMSLFRLTAWERGT